jgi:putative copper export protein
MIELVIGGLAAMGGAVYAALDEPAAQNRQRNRRISATLLAISAVMLLLGLLYGLSQSL